MHHFILLNHFRHGIKISFTFYHFTSMSKGIEGFKRKPTANPTLHKGLLLLVYEYLKTQTRGKSLGDTGCASKETRSSHSKEVHSIKSNDEDNTSSKGKTHKEERNVTPSACIPCKKSPRSLPPIPPKSEPQEEEDDDEEEDTKSEEEEKGEENVKEEEKGKESEKEEEVSADMPENPRKRKVDEASM